MSIYTLFDLREAAAGAGVTGSDEDLIKDYARRTGMNPIEVANQLGYDGGASTRNRERGSASIDSYQANLYGLAEAVTGADWARSGRERNEFQSEVARSRAADMGAISSFRDIGSREGYIDDSLNWLGGLAIDSAPYLIEAGAGGLIGRGLAVGARAGGAVAREMGMVGAERAAATQVGRAGMAGGAIASYPSAVGDVLSAQREQSGGEMDLLSAAGLGVPYAALNMLGIEGALSRGGLTRNIVGTLDEAPGIMGGAKRAGAAMVTTGAVEGASETGQEFLNQAGRNAVDPNAGYFGPEAMDRYAESFVGGAALGGVFGGLGGARRSEAYHHRQQDLLLAEQERQAEHERRVAEANALELARAQQAREALTPPEYLALPAPRPATVVEPTTATGEGTFVGFPDGVVAANPDQELMARYGMTPEQLDAIRGAPAGTTPSAPKAPVTPANLFDKRADDVIGSNPPHRARVLGAQLYKLMDEGRATEEEIDEYLSALGAERRRYGPIETFIKERNAAAPVVPGSAPVVAGPGAAPGTQPAGSSGDLGRVAGSENGVRTPPGAPALSGPTPAPVGDGTAGDAAPAVTGPVVTVDPETGVKKTVLPYIEPPKEGSKAESEEAAAFRRGFAAKLAERPVEGRTLLERWLGVAVNEDGDLSLVEQSDRLEDLAATMIATRGKNKGKAGVSKEAARKRVLNELKAAGAPDGISPRQLYQRLGFQLSDLDLETLDRMTAEYSAGGKTEVEAAPDEAGIAATAVDTGFDTADETDTGGMALTAEAVPERNAEDDVAEVEAAAEEVELDAYEVGEPWMDMLRDDVAEGRVTREDMDEVPIAIEMSGAKQWNRLTNHDRALAARVYARARLAGDPTISRIKEIANERRQAATAGRPGQAADARPAGAAAPRTQGAGGQQLAVQRNDAQAVGNLGQVGGSGAAPVVVRKPKVHRVGGKSAAKTVAEAAPAPVATPKEQWAALAAKTPGMPAWEALDAPQQARWTDMAHRDVANLAAAVNIAGENPAPLGPEKLNSGRPATDLNTALRTAVTKDEFAQVEGAAEAFADLEALGIGHATDWVDTWIVGAESTYHMRGRQQVVEILPAGSVDLNGNTRTADDVRFDVAHEVGHAVDIASNGSVYSSQPELEFMSFGGDIRPVGEVAVEIENAMQESVALRALMEYPYDTTKFPEVATPKRAQQELFAQLFGMYAHPLGRKHLARYAPQAYKFITEVVQDVQSTKVDPGHSRGTAIRRGAGFLARAAAPQKRNAPASAGVLGSGTEGKLGSRSTQAVAAFEREQSAVARVTENLRPRAKDATTNLRDWFKKHAPWALTSFQLAEQFGDKVAGLVRYIALTDAAKTERTRLQMIYRETAVVWDKLPTKVKERLNELMQRATLDEVHPDLEFEDDANKHLRRKDPEADAAMRAEYQVLADQYNALPQEARDVYQRAKKDLEDSWKKRAEAYRTLVSDTYHDELVKAIEAGDAARHEELTGIIDKALKEHDQMLSSIKGPYFPLMRFGEYLAIGESSEYLQAQKDWAEAEGDVRKEAAKKLDKLKRDGNHYVVSAHETRAAAERTLREYAAKGLTTRSGMAGLKLDQLRAVTQDTVRHMEDAVSKRLGGGLDTAATDALREVFLQGLPEMHALRREAARKGIEGASVDMLRAYTNAGQSNAFYTSRLMYAKDMADAMFEMKDKTKGNTDLTHVAREMEQRMALDLKFTETPLQDLASSVTWAYMLGVSPAYLAINTMQPFLVTAPVLAGKFGPAVTMREVGRAARDALRVLKATRWKDGKWDGWSGVNEESIPGPSRNEDRAAIRALLERGILDEGMHHELNMFAQGGSRLLAKANRYMSWATQQVEMTNRITTALAAFRLARKDGMTEEQATDFAYKTVNGTQFDYSPEGSARMMREGGGIMGAKLVFQFRRYQQNMLYLLGANIKKSFGEGQEAKDARATLVYLSIATGMTAGVTGLPFMGLALAVANALRDDDDEDGDAETALRNALFDLTGDRRLADILAKGAPAMFGMDLSKRVGLADVANPFPFARLDRAETGRDVGSELLFNLAGPSAGVGANFAEGVRLMAGGDFVKGVEKLVPKMFADPIKAARYATKGFTDSRGDEILGADELDAWDKAYRFLGFQPTVESNYYEGTKAKMGVKTAIEDRKGKIGNAFKVALRDGNMADVREMIREYNADHPTAKILPKDEIRWRKDALKARSQRDGSGVKFDPKRDRNYEEVMRFVR